MTTMLANERRTLVETVRAFAEREVAPGALEADRVGGFRRDVWARLGELGLLGLPLPVEHGGAGGGAVETALAMEAFARAGGDAGTALSWGAHSILCAVPIARLGDIEQQARYLPRLASGAWIGAFALTEPGAGSDAGALRTRARRDSDGWVLDGSKMFVTNAPVADLFLVLARTGEGTSAFLVERTAAGLSVGEPLRKLGNRTSPTAELVLDACHVPAAALLGPEGRGLETVAQLALTWERTCLLAAAVGAQGYLLERSAAHARVREQFGRPLAAFGAIAGALAEMRVRLEASQLLLAHAAEALDRGDEGALEAATAKLAISEALGATADDAVQVHGGYGYLDEEPVERAYRDARLARIGGGTSEIQRGIIARALVDWRAGRVLREPLGPWPGLDDDAAEWVATVAAAARERLAPLAATVDVDGRIPDGSWSLLAELGFLGATYPEAAAGAAAPLAVAAAAAVELAAACPATALSAGASSLLCGTPVLLLGGPDRQARILPRLADASWRGCLALTEPGCGSDLASLTTTAQPDGDGWVLDGAKAFITNAPECNVAVVLARTPEGFGLFLVERGAPGFEPGPPYAKLGCRGSATGDLRLDRCRVGADALLGDGVSGFAAAMRVLEHARVGFAAWCLGVALGAYREAAAYAVERHAFGRAIAAFQDVHFALADMHVAIAAGQLLVARAAEAVDAGERDAGMLASIAKLWCSRGAARCANGTVQVHGGAGYVHGTAAERLYRDARLAEIGEGTTEIQRQLIARAVLSGHAF